MEFQIYMINDDPVAVRQEPLNRQGPPPPTHEEPPPTYSLATDQYVQPPNYEQAVYQQQPLATQHVPVVHRQPTPVYTML